MFSTDTTKLSSLPSDMVISSSRMRSAGDFFGGFLGSAPHGPSNRGERLGCRSHRRCRRRVQAKCECRGTIDEKHISTSSTFPTADQGCPWKVREGSAAFSLKILVG